MKPRNPYGFTLVELLVVIAIITVLAALLFPVFSSAHRKGVPDDGAPVGDNWHSYADCLYLGHFDSTNSLFTDGHVKALKPTATYQGVTANFWYHDATPLSAEGRQTLIQAEMRGD